MVNVRSTDVNSVSCLFPSPTWRLRNGNSAKRGRERESVPSYEASMRNLARAQARWRPPRPWRSKQESEAIRRFAFQWLTCRDRNRPSGRTWARGLGISHTWLQKLILEFTADPSKMRRLQAYGDPTSAQLSRAQRYTQQMKERGELRSSRRATD